jgi:hypothetical protein
MCFVHISKGQYKNSTDFYHFTDVKTKAGELIYPSLANQKSKQGRGQVAWAAPSPLETHGLPPCRLLPTQLRPPHLMVRMP